MKRKSPILTVLLLAASFGGWLLLHRGPLAKHQAPPPTVELPKPETIAQGVTVTTIFSSGNREHPGQHQPLLGETILRGYAEPALPPENDLALMSHLMDNSLLLLKSAANRPLSANGDWAGLLRGQNAARARFLPDDHIALNKDGELVDRWGSPLFFHALGDGRYEIRSAGPDKKMWTEDDIHRDADGSIRHGAEATRPRSLTAKS
jgi:hypothetical protein